MPRHYEAAAASLDRQAKRDLEILPIETLSLRQECLSDVYTYLQTIHADVFTQPFTATRREMIGGIIHAARYGGDQAIAGPRGEGKTRSALYVALWLVLRGDCRFPLIVSKSGPRAQSELKSLKQSLVRNQAFGKLFPELATCIRVVGRWASKAKQQTVYGHYTDMEWLADSIVFPTIPHDLLMRHSWNGAETCASGQIFSCLGVEGPVRGHSIRNQRPDLVILDDVDDRESSGSELQTATRERIIDEDVAGLAGPDRKVARIMLCTLINRTCVAATYTDRALKPSWNGQRHKLLATLPDRQDLWQEYVELRRGKTPDDPNARRAHQFYLDNRVEMDAGAEVTNEFRFDPRPLPDGEPGELSTLQSCYNRIADVGWDSFATEFQNDPPELDGPQESGINPRLIQKQVSGLTKGVIPDNCVALTHGVDVGKWYLHWVVRAWLADGTGYTIDYGRQDVVGAVYRVDVGLDKAIKAAIARRISDFESADYHTADGQGIAEPLTLIDASYRTDAVYQACATAGSNVFPVMGIGRGTGPVEANFSPLQKPPRGVKIGDGWKIVPKDRIRLVECDTYRWKAWEHDRWMTSAGEAGCLYLWGEPADDPTRLSPDERGHLEYAEHICAEVEIEEVYKGSLRRLWKPKHKENHWLDASYYADVAANIRHVRLAGPVITRQRTIPQQALRETVKPSQRMSLSQLAKGKR